MKRVIFMGTPDFAVPSFYALLENNYQVVAVVTQPDRPQGRKKEVIYSPVKQVAIKHNIPILQPEKLRDPIAIAQVLAYKPDVIVTAAYGQILPQQLLQAPPFGCINVHASLLPHYRGGAPVHWALLNGETETGITIMYMVEALDAGDILAQRAIKILLDDHTGILYERLANLGGEMLIEVLPALFAGTIIARPQDENKVTYAWNIKRKDEQILWTKSATEIYNQVRGLHPWPVATTVWRGQWLKIWWADVITSETKTSVPGTIFKIDQSGIYVACGQDSLRIQEIQIQGKKRMTIQQFICGRQLEVGDRLG